MSRFQILLQQVSIRGVCEMPALARGQSSSCAAPILDLFTQVNGALMDVSVLKFQIFDVSDAINQNNPVQVYPTQPGERASVNVFELCPNGDKLSTGHFVARYTAPIDAAIGTHRIQWFFKLTDSSPEQTFSEEFEILPEVTGTAQLAYCFVQDLRDEGYLREKFSDDRVLTRIEFASRYIDSVTERFFEPRAMTLELDGNGSSELLLDQPIIGIEEVTIIEQGLGGIPLIGTADPSSYRVYNRHLTEKLLKPDDRENPKISFLEDNAPARPLLGYGFIFPKGVQNIRVKGVFGYTEADGSPTGRTPILIREVCKRLVIRELPLLSEISQREDVDRRHRLLSERTRDQSYTLDRPTLYGAFTGDPTIDNILIQFKRPADLGAA